MRRDGERALPLQKKYRRPRAERDYSMTFDQTLILSPQARLAVRRDPDAGVCPAQACCAVAGNEATAGAAEGSLSCA